MKNNYILYFTLLLIALTTTRCVSDPDMPDSIQNAAVPTTKTGDISGITANTITISGEVIYENGATVTERGFCWGETSPLTLSNAAGHLAIGAGKGDFSETITTLKNSTYYYIRSYAKNIAGEGYGEETRFTTTSGLGSVKTLKATDITPESVTLGGEILYAGEGEITKRGIFYAMKKEALETEERIEAVSQTTTSTYLCKLEGLLPDSTYYAQAFVTNHFGTFTGEVISFRMLDGKATVTTPEILWVGLTGATLSAEVTDEGYGSVFERGFCYSAFNEEPIYEVDERQLASGTGSGEYIADIINLVLSSTYYVRAYARSEYGIAYSKSIPLITLSQYPITTIDSLRVRNNELVMAYAAVESKGSSDIHTMGFCWSTNSKPTIEDDHIEFPSSQTNLFEAILPKLQGGTEYYVRAFAYNNASEDEPSYSKNELRVSTPPTTKQLAPYPLRIQTEGTASAFTIFNNTNNQHLAYIVGGDLGSSYTNKLYCYIPSEDIWDERAPLPYTISRTSAAGSAMNGYIYGGWINSSNPVPNDSLRSYNARNNVWVSIPRHENMVAMANAMGTSYAEYIVMGGGLEKSNKISNKVSVYNQNLVTWEYIKTLPERQFGGLGVTIGQTVYFGLGKTDFNNDTYSKKFWSWNTPHNEEYQTSWKSETEFPSEQGCKAGTALGNTIYVIDGAMQIWSYDTTDRSWTAKGKIQSKREPVFCMFTLNNLIYIGYGNRFDKFISYNPAWDN